MVFGTVTECENFDDQGTRVAADRWTIGKGFASTAVGARRRARSPRGARAGGGQRGPRSRSAAGRSQSGDPGPREGGRPRRMRGRAEVRGPAKALTWTCPGSAGTGPPPSPGRRGRWSWHSGPRSRSRSSRRAWTGTPARRAPGRGSHSTAASCSRPAARRRRRRHRRPPAELSTAPGPPAAGDQCGPGPPVPSFPAPLPGRDALSGAYRDASEGKSSRRGEHRAAAAAASPPHRRLLQSRSLVRRDRSQTLSPPLGSLQSHSGIASPSPDLVRGRPSPPPRRPGPGRRRGAGDAGCAGRSGGDLREGEGDPARSPASPTARANLFSSQPDAPGRAGATGAPRWARPTREGGLGKRGSASPAPAGRRRPPRSHFLSGNVSQMPVLPLEPAGCCAASPTRACLRSSPHRPCAWSRPAPTGTRDSSARPHNPARRLRGERPARCGARARRTLPLGVPGKSAPLAPRASWAPPDERSDRDRLRSFSRK